MSETKPIEVVTELRIVKSEIQKIKSAEYAREWRKNNKERKRQENKNWNYKFRNEYQREYYKKNIKSAKL